MPTTSLARTPSSASSEAETGAGRGVDRLELRVERLQVTFRFTFAFHARELRFERGSGDEFERVFPETFSFHVERHDPTELLVQLDDLLRKPRLLAPEAQRRDSQELVMRLLGNAPRYLEGVLDRLARERRLEGGTRARIHRDVAITSQVMLGFLESRELDGRRSLRLAEFHLCKLLHRCLGVLVEELVDADFLERYVRGEVELVDPSDDPSVSGVFHTLETGPSETVNRIALRMAERAFFRWVEGVCLEEENEAFEKEDSPFADREREVLAAVAAEAGVEIQRGEDLSPFLRRRTKDCLRVLGKLEAWFLRRYDIAHSAAVIHHAAALQRGEDDGSRVLTRHRPRNYALLLGAMLSPFVGAAFAYDRFPLFFDAACAAEVLLVNAAAVWFLAYRFCWKRDLTFFHASVPRIGAGIIVGYLPVFLIDEVWDLAERGAFTLLSVSLLLGVTTLLYIYVEVQRRLGDPIIAFERARSIFVLGVLLAFGIGLVMTSLVGNFMVSRNWSPDGGPLLPIEVLRTGLDPIVGALPRVLGLEPFYVFPPAVLMMTFLSFFIGIFLQLMWEDLPITEPL
jgi:hypothetical protein